MSHFPTLKDIKKSACAARNSHLINAEPEVKKRNKYLNDPVDFDGKTFQSTKERDRYITLRMLLREGIIKDLECQVEFILEAADKKVCSYFADFTYTEVASGKMIVEDVKSKATRRLAVYRLKKKLMHACYGITIKEV